MDYIAPIKDQLDKIMKGKCEAFMLSEMPSKSPRWINFGDFDLETKVLTIESTQRSDISFKIETDFDFIEVDEFWPQFKEYRTEFLLANYPTINPY
jgi:hypothetical protein